MKRASLASPSEEAINRTPLTHWGRVMHICVGKLTSIGSDNGLLPGRRHYLNQCWNIVNWTLQNNLQWNFNRNSNIFIQENALENVVCEMASILSQSQWVNSCHAEFISGNRKINFACSIIFRLSDGTIGWNYSPYVVYKDLFIPHSQYNCCWWPGVVSSQCISMHATDLVVQEY